MTGETMESMTIAVRYMAPVLASCPLAGIEAANSIMDGAMYGNNAAKAAIEMAWHDALGRALGKPVYALLGRKLRERVPALWMLGTGDADADVADRLQARRRLRGLQDKSASLNPPPTLRHPALCAALGPNTSPRTPIRLAGKQALTYVRAVADTARFLEHPCANVLGPAGESRAETRLPTVSTRADSIEISPHMNGRRPWSAESIKLGDCGVYRRGPGDSLA